VRKNVMFGTCLREQRAVVATMRCIAATARLSKAEK